MLFTQHINNAPDTSNMIVNFCLVDVTCQSNVDSIGVAKWTIYCHLLSPVARRSEGWGGEETEGGAKTHQIYKSHTLDIRTLGRSETVAIPVN